MKLLFCPECGDTKKLSTNLRWCECKQSSGMYRADGLTADVYGPGLVIGFDNFQLLRVLKLHDITPYENLTVAAWLMGELTPNVTYHRSEE